MIELWLFWLWNLLWLALLTSKIIEVLDWLLCLFERFLVFLLLFGLVLFLVLFLFCDLWCRINWSSKFARRLFSSVSAR